MAIKIAPWIKETCITSGTGPLVLTGSPSSFIRFNETIGSGDTVYYAILDSNGNRESGIGTFDGIATVTRTTVTATLIGLIYNDINPTALNLTGSSVVICSFTEAAYNNLPKIGDFGIGMDGLYSNVASLDALRAIGIYSYAGTDPSSPTVSGGSVIVTRHLDLYLHQFIFVGQNATTYIRHSADNGDTWSDWEYNYTTANIEFNKIGGPAAFAGGHGTLVNGYLMSGYAYSTSAVTLMKPISLVNRPTFFEEVSDADEFRIYGADGTVHGADIVTPFSNVLFSTGTSSNGMLIVNITGLGAGLTIGEPVTLRALTAGAGFIYS